MFQKGFGLIVDRMEHRLYPSVSAFVGDIRSVLRSFPSDPKLDFEIRIKSYAPPSIALPPPTASKEQIAATGAKILNSLKVAFDNALAGEYSMRQSMPERAAKKPRLLEHLGSILVDTSANVNGAVSPGLNSPSLQLVKESLPQKDKGKATPTPAGLEAPERQGGGTILGTVASVLAKEITVGFERPKDESHDTTGMDIDTEPVTVDHISHHIHAPLSAKSEAILANAEAEQHVTRSLSPQPAPEIENLNGIQPVITAPAEMSTFDDDFDMEDAPGDVDEDFIPPVEAPSFAPISVAPNPVHEDKHIDPHEEDEDEDAEGDIDDEVPPPYTRPPPPPPVITTLPDTTIFPDVDPAHSDLGNEDDLLLGGYRPEDLPSPLGTIMGESTSPMDTSADTANAMLDASHFQQHQPSNRDPMTDLPDLPPNNGLPDKQELLENMTNTSVLSDYPDDLDENDFGMHMRGDDEGGDDDDDADEADDEERGENEATPPGKKSRKSMTFKRESNGRFGRAASGRERRKRR